MDRRSDWKQNVPYRIVSRKWSVMVEDASPIRRRPGRPRSDQSREAILAATAALLTEQGLLGLTIEAVAARAGVGKATIYRWWKTKEALALDAFVAGFIAVPPPALTDTGSLAGDLRTIMVERMRVSSLPGEVRVYSALLAQVREDPAFAAEYRARIYEPQRQRGRDLFARAMARGEIGADADIEAALDLLTGATLYRNMQGHAPVDAAFIDTIVTIVVTGLTADGTPPA
jgi:AcrR family transcriptional regulator